MFELIKYKENSCIEENDRVWTYGEVNVLANIVNSNIITKSLILCLCENTAYSLIGYIAFVLKGNVPILIENDQKMEIINKIIENYNPEYIWAKESQINELPFSEVVCRLENYILLRLIYKYNNYFYINPILQLLLTTSGSTGSIKFVRLTTANLLVNSYSIIDYLKINSNDVAITTLPYSYSFGLSIINTHLIAGASIQLTKFTPMNREFWDIVRKKQVTSISGVPYTFEMLKRIRFERFELPSMRYLSQAGGKMTAQGLAYLKQLTEENKLSCFVMYGQTEAAPRMSYLSQDNFELKLGSIGRAISGGNFTIRNDTGEIVESAYVKGELVYTGPNVALGYATSRMDLARGDDWHGILSTGDLAYRDLDGFYYITGRLKRILKIFGNRISLDETESLLQTEFKQCEFICIGRDDLLSIGYTGEINPDVLSLFVSRILAIRKSSIKCFSVPEIPRLSNGKINYASASFTIDN